VRAIRAAVGAVFEGDSGGPFYWGNTAYGFDCCWRYDPIWPFDRDLFSRADRLDDALGVWVVH
jgi:hypothetical protein